MGTRRSHRRDLGPKFSEATRLVWVRMEAKGWTRSRLAEELAIDRASLHRLLYGDNAAGRELSLTIQSVLGIEPRLWAAKPRQKFTLPAAHAA